MTYLSEWALSQYFEQLKVAGVDLLPFPGDIVDLYLWFHDVIVILQHRAMKSNS